MRTVRDESGKRYLLLKQSGDSSRVRDPETGEERHLPNDSLDVVDGESPLVTASRAVPEPLRRLLTATHDERALGLLLEIAAREPVDVRTLLSAVDCCESDLHGMLAEFQAAGLLAETDVAGIRGYETTADGREALEVLTSGEAIGFTTDGESHDATSEGESHDATSEGESREVTTDSEAPTGDE